MVSVTRAGELGSPVKSLGALCHVPWVIPQQL